MRIILTEKYEGGLQLLLYKFCTEAGNYNVEISKE